jgi:hypothetical protein
VRAGTLFGWAQETNNTKVLEYRSRISEFYDGVFLPLVYADMAVLLEKYVKRCQFTWA